MPAFINAQFGVQDFRVLYVDDEPANCVAFLAAFRRDANISTTSSLEESLALLDQHPVDLLITDHKMPQGTGLELLQSISGRFPDMTRVMITAYAEKDLVKKALNEGGIRWFLEKPWDPSEIRQIIRRTFQEGVDRDLRRIEIYKLAKAQREAEQV